MSTPSLHSLSAQASPSGRPPLGFTNEDVKSLLVQYDVAITHLECAIECVESGDIEGRCNHTNDAINVITELYMDITLRNVTMGEELQAIYSYMIWKLPTVNFKNEAKVAENVIKILYMLRDSWAKTSRQRAHAHMIAENSPVIPFTLKAEFNG